MIQDHIFRSLMYVPIQRQKVPWHKIIVARTIVKFSLFEIYKKKTFCRTHVSLTISLVFILILFTVDLNYTGLQTNFNLKKYNYNTFIFIPYVVYISFIALVQFCVLFTNKCVSALLVGTTVILKNNRGM